MSFRIKLLLQLPESIQLNGQNIKFYNMYTSAEKIFGSKISFYLLIFFAKNIFNMSYNSHIYVLWNA